MSKNNDSLAKLMLSDGARWVEMVDVFRVDSANINAGEGGPNEIDVKAIHLEDGTVVPRISSQSIFRMIRDYWVQQGENVDVALTSPGAGVITLGNDPVEYIDDDLFGYLIAQAGEAGERGVSQARSGPIRSIGAIGLFEYPDDTDFLTCIRSVTGAEAGGSIATRRLYTNTFVLPIWCDPRRIGRELDPQADKKLQATALVDDSERERRFKLFWESLFYLGKFKGGNYKMPLSPKLIMVGIFSKPNIALYDALQNDLTVRLKEVHLQRERDERKDTEKMISVASGKVIFSLDPASLREKLEIYGSDLIKLHIGIMESFFEKSANDLNLELHNSLPGTIKDKVVVEKLSGLKEKLLS